MPQRFGSEKRPFGRRRRAAAARRAATSAASSPRDGARADVVEPAVVAIQAEQQRRDLPSGRPSSGSPTTTQSAVLCSFTLTTPSREPGRYGSTEPLRDHAVEPERLEALEPRRAPRRRRASRARAESPSRRLDARAALLERQLPDRLAVPEQHVEDDELGRDLGRELPDARLGRMQAHLHRVEVERAVARDHDLAVERRARRQQVAERPQLREVPQQRPPVPRPQRKLACPAFSSTPRKPSHFGSYCQPSPSGSSRTSSASIGGNGTIAAGMSASKPSVEAWLSA